MVHSFCYVLLFVTILSLEGCQGSFKGVTFTPGYDKAFPPTFYSLKGGKWTFLNNNASGVVTNGTLLLDRAVKVKFGISIQTVAPIQSSEMEFRVNMRLWMSWEEPRVSVDLLHWYDTDDDDEDCPQYLVATDELSKKMWKPDLYIVNAKYTGIKSFNHKLSQLQLFENHTVVYTLVMNATVACDMNFEYYPMDIQLCPIVIRSFAYEKSQLDLGWRMHDQFVVRPLRLIQFSVVKPPPVQRHYVQLFLQGNVTELVATVRLERLISSILVQSFIPCFLVVALSWFSFWLEFDALAARGFLLMACVLSLEIHLLGLKWEFPPVAYVKAVDVWIFGCIFWIFCALLEFIVILTIYNVTEEERKANKILYLHKPKTKVAFITSPDGGVVSEMHGRKGGESRSESANTYSIPPYTEFWLWDELKAPQNCPNVPSSFKVNKRLLFERRRKDRLGSAVLSGRSAATSEIPPLSQTFSWCPRVRLPLVWRDKVKDDGNEHYHQRRVKTHLLWREIDNHAKWVFPVTFVLFMTIYWITLVAHSYTV